MMLIVPGVKAVQSSSVQLQSVKVSKDCKHITEELARIVSGKAIKVEIKNV